MGTSPHAHPGPRSSSRQKCQGWQSLAGSPEAACFLLESQLGGGGQEHRWPGTLVFFCLHSWEPGQGDTAAAGPLLPGLGPECAYPSPWLGKTESQVSSQLCLLGSHTGNRSRTGDSAGSGNWGAAACSQHPQKRGHRLPAAAATLRPCRQLCSE